MLDPSVLISPVLSLDALNIAGADRTFRVYLHDRAGRVAVGAGSMPQTITSLAPPARWLQFAEQQLAAISSRVNVRFERVVDAAQADLAVYLDTEINLDQSTGITFGITLPNVDRQTRRQWTEIFLNGTQLQSQTEDFSKYVFNHELLHALGLEHTFDNSDSDYYLSTNPLLSATPEQTVMSYRQPISGRWPVDLTEDDYRALIQIWGAAAPVISRASSAGSLQSTSQPSSQVFRLFQASTGKHLFSSNAAEIDLLTGTNGSGFVNEGLAYAVSSGANQELYRFYQPSTGVHFYSANAAERDGLVAAVGSGYLYEGVAYRVFAATAAPQGSTAVVRFYDPSRGTHFYTASAAEQRILETSQPTWVREGAAWYV